MLKAVVSTEIKNNGGYLSHRTFHKLLKKFKRKKKRSLAAIEANVQEVAPVENDDEYVLAEYELERERNHQEWLEREKIAQLEWEKKEQQRMILKKEKEKQEKKIKEDWEALKKKIDEDLADKERKVQEEIDTQDRWLKQINELAESGVLPSGWNAVQSPPAGQLVCPFYTKVAACRFGDRCSRFHPKPVLSNTVLMPHFFSNVKWTIVPFSKDDKLDSGLEFEDSEVYEYFREFYEDVKPEFESVGKVVQLRVCSNSEPHLRGNLYVQYKKVSEAARAYLLFQGRFYAGKQMTAHFVQIPDWHAAVCGWYFTRHCARERNCNFLHVFRNPDDEFSLRRSRTTPAAAPTPRITRESDKRKWSTSSSSRSPSPSSRHSRTSPRRGTNETSRPLSDRGSYKSNRTDSLKSAKRESKTQVAKRDRRSRSPSRSYKTSPRPRRRSRSIRRRERSFSPVRRKRLSPKRRENSPKGGKVARSCRRERSPMTKKGSSQKHDKIPPLQKRSEKSPKKTRKKITSSSSDTESPTESRSELPERKIPLQKPPKKLPEKTRKRKSRTSSSSGSGSSSDSARDLPKGKVQGSVQTKTNDQKISDLPQKEPRPLNTSETLKINLDATKSEADKRRSVSRSSDSSEDLEVLRQKVLLSCGDRGKPDKQLTGDGSSSSDSSDSDASSSTSESDDSKPSS